MTPRAAITKHLLDGDDSFLTGKFDDERPKQQPQTPAAQDKPEEKPDKPAGPVFDPDAT